MSCVITDLNGARAEQVEKLPKDRADLILKLQADTVSLGLGAISTRRS